MAIAIPTVVEKMFAKKQTRKKSKTNKIKQQTKKFEN